MTNKWNHFGGVDCSTVSGFNILKIHLNKSGLLPDWGSLLKYPILTFESIEIMGNSHCIRSHCGSTCCAAEPLSPTLMQKGIIYWNLQQDLLSEYTSCPWVRRNYSVSTEISLSWCKLGLLNAICLKWNMHPWRREDGDPDLAYPTPRPSPHAWQ